MKYFYLSFVITFLGLLIAFFIGSFAAVYICFLLTILEVSLSFDNAVVNAKILNNMSKIWQRRFITWGIFIAVFGMRLIFPILIVSIATKHGLTETFMLALKDPDLYHEILSESKNEIYIFGGGFLMMIFLNFFFDKERDVFWIKPFEKNIITEFFKKFNNISLTLALILGVFIIYQSGDISLILAYFSAIILYNLIQNFDDVFSKNGIRNGIIGFLYLEMLDASFSFDGVIGAFALSENIFIIMIGLGSGAMFVRSMTLYLVEHKTLEHFIFLEHGAHYAIFALAVIMLLKTQMQISEILTGTLGFGFILLSFLCSIFYKKLKNRQKFTV
ncbi:DUF475 domain-containing protein [Campylobacter hominis]